MDRKGENAVENIREFNTFYTKIYIPLKGIKPVVFYKLVINYDRIYFEQHNIFKSLFLRNNTSIWCSIIFDLIIKICKTVEQSLIMIIKLTLVFQLIKFLDRLF